MRNLSIVWVPERNAAFLAVKAVSRSGSPTTTSVLSVGAEVLIIVSIAGWLYVCEGKNEAWGMRRLLMCHQLSTGFVEWMDKTGFGPLLS